MKASLDLPQDLSYFLKEYERLTNLCNFDSIKPFIDENAIYWFSNGDYVGIEKIRKAFEDTWHSIKEEKYSLSNIQWLIVSESEAVCVYNFHSDGFVNGTKQIYDGRGTNIFKKVNGQWKIIHEHLSKLV